METPDYIKALLRPNGRKPAGRRVWSIDLETVWLPFFTATNTMGDTAIPHEALGAPLRLAYNADGTVKFSQTGRPVIKVAKEIADMIVEGLELENVEYKFREVYREERMARRRENHAPRHKKSQEQRLETETQQQTSSKKSCPRSHKQLKLLSPNSFF